jgi:hypothetical protein
MRSKEDIAAELEAHLLDLEHFEARTAKYVASASEEDKEALAAELKAHSEDVAAFRAAHAERVAVLKAELG